MKNSILLSMLLLLVSGISSLAQTNKVPFQDIDKNVLTYTSNTAQDTSSNKIQIRKYPFNPINQNGLPPVIVIDGKISDHGTSCLEPNDIQSISVYKGKKAASLYGDNNGGVILITTKKRASEIKSEKEPAKE